MSVRQRQVMGVTAAILAAVVLLWQMDQRVFAGQNTSCAVEADGDRRVRGVQTPV